MTPELMRDSDKVKLPLVYGFSWTFPFCPELKNLGSILQGITPLSTVAPLLVLCRGTGAYISCPNTFDFETVYSEAFFCV